MDVVAYLTRSSNKVSACSSPDTNLLENINHKPVMVLCSIVYLFLYNKGENLFDEYMITYSAAAPWLKKYAKLSRSSDFVLI